MRTPNQRPKCLAEHWADVINEPGFGECSQLCDPSRVEQVCGDMLPEAFASACEGVRPDNLILALSELLHAPLLRYAEQQEDQRRAMLKQREADGRGGDIRLNTFDQAVALLEAVEEVVRLLESGGRPPDEQEVVGLQLRLAWYRWIASVASALVYDTATRRIARNRQSAHQSNKHGSAGRPAQHDAAAVLACYDRMVERVGKRFAAGSTAKAMGCTPHHVRRLDQKRQKTKRT